MPALGISKRLRAHWEREKRNNKASYLRDVILGGQDGVVNVLGITLGVAAATNDTGIVIVAALAATFAESVSMAAVAYTSGKAESDYYYGMREKEALEIEELPEIEREEVKVMFMRKGFKGKELENAVKSICSDKKRWLDTMMSEELGLGEPEKGKPLKDCAVVGFSSLAGSFLPILPFFVLPVQPSMWVSLGAAIAVLFAAGAVKARMTIGNWKKEGVEMAAIGTAAALVGYAVGILLKVAP